MFKWFGTTFSLGAPEKQDIPRLADALGIPPVIKCQQRSICDGTEGLCMLLRRFAYPCRLSDMIARF